MENVPVVLDCGSAYVRAGFSVDDCPKLLIPTLVGNRTNKKDGSSRSSGISSSERRVFVGEDARANTEQLVLSSPITKGVVTSWEDMEKVYEHVYSVLGVSSSEHRVLLTEPILNDKKRDREKSIELFFERFHVPSYYVSAQPVLALYASGRVTGTVLDMGEGQTSVTPVYEGYALLHAIQRADIAGAEITQQLEQLLKESNMRDAEEKRSVGLDIFGMRRLKEKVCYVALNFESELEKEEKSVREVYELPDGKSITLGRERFCAPELLFDASSLIGTASSSLPSLVVKAIELCDVDIRKTLSGDIVLAGASSLFSGLPERLHQDLTRLMPTTKFQVRAVPERGFLTWVGGSIMASLSTFKGMWITASEYEETGVQVVHRKCF